MFDASDTLFEEDEEEREVSQEGELELDLGDLQGIQFSCLETDMV